MTLPEIKQKIKNKITAYKGRLKSAEDKAFMEGKIAGLTESLSLLGKFSEDWFTGNPKEPGNYIMAFVPYDDLDAIYYGWAEWDGEGFDINYDDSSEDHIIGWFKIPPCIEDKIIEVK